MAKLLISLLCFTVPSIAHEYFISPAIHLDFGEREHLILAGRVPSLICVQKPSYCSWLISSFQKSCFVINATSRSSFPIRVFASTNEADLISRSPWNKESSSTMILTNFFYSSSKSAPDFFEVQENSRVDLPGMDGHCVALFSATNSNSFDNNQHVFNVAFEKRVDWIRIFCFLFGLTVYLTASELSHTLTFYYISGVGLSVTGGLLILVLLCMRIFPKRTSLVIQGLIVIGGGTFSLFFLTLDYLRSALWSFLTNNADLVTYYVLSMCVLSGSLIYWLSLPERLIQSFPRTHTVVRLLLRTSGILLVASSPQVPSDIPILTSTFQSIADCVKTHLHVNIHQIMPSSPLIYRVAFTTIILIALYFVHALRKLDRHNRVQSRREYHLPPVPCAASSPYNNHHRRFWQPPGSDYCGTALTTNYGGYGYPSINEYSDDYWDGSGRVFSPVPRSRMSGVPTPIQKQRVQSPMSNDFKRRRSQVGWIVTQDVIFTDDEDEDRN